MKKRKRKYSIANLKHTIFSLEILINDYYSLGYIYRAQEKQDELDNIQKELEKLKADRGGEKKWI